MLQVSRLLHSVRLLALAAMTTHLALQVGKTIWPPELVSKMELTIEPFFVGDPPFHLTVGTEPKELQEGSDAQITVTITPFHFESRSQRVGSATVGIESESFKIVPIGAQRLGLERERVVQFVASPIGPGEKKLRVYARYVTPATSANRTTPAAPVSERQQVLSLRVMERYSLFGLSKDQLSLAQTVSLLIGLPSILILVVTRVLDNMREKRKSLETTGSDAKKIIIP